MPFQQLPDGRIVPIQAKKQSMRGVGDLVARAAAPVASLLGIQSCASCDQRQALLNSMFPFGRKK